MKPINILNYKLLANPFLLLTLFLFATNANAQIVKDTINVTPKDSLGFNKSRIILANPPSVVELYTYDPVKNRYIFTSTISGLAVDYPVMLTPDEYNKRLLKEKMRKYFQDKASAVAGQKKGSDAKRRDLIPRIYVNSGLFSTIFGSNTIDIKPTGSVEIDLGLRYTKQENPAISPVNQSSTTFDFNQRISVGMQGKVGTRLGVNFNYDTQSTFAFQNLFKLEFNPGDIAVGGVSVDDAKGAVDKAKGAIDKVSNFKDAIPKSVSGTNDDILQKLEIGNISMPLSSSLIRGAQSLFGVKAQFKFGNTSITALYSEQKSQTKSVTSENGGTVQLFDIFGLDYDADRHFFLSQYFRNEYDKSLKSYPVIDSRVQITRVEVWITNKQNRINSTENNMRNIVAIQDLGEANLTGVPNVVGANSLTWTGAGGFFGTTLNNEPSNNSNNKYDPAYLLTGNGILNQNIRDISNVLNGFNGFPAGGNPQDGRDFAKLENARKLTDREFTFHPQLGYISLQQKLANDEVLAVAYQYTIGDVVYQVGEFANNGVASTQVTAGVPSTQSLIVKMLKSSLTNVDQPVWNLMMKNIYQLQGAYQLQPQDFKFNIVYSDPSPLNYITPAAGLTPLPLPASVENTALLHVFNMDNLNSTNDPQQPKGDGFFDFIPGLTVDSQNGRIIFTSAEPFGKYLFEKLRNSTSEDYYNPLTYNTNQAKYVYRSLYKGTQTAALQDAVKNKFELKGKYKASGGDGIPIGAINVPKGSVVVTAGGRVLTEGVDYTVNYQQGRVQILDPSLQASGIPIQVSVENNAIFGQQTRRFYGLNVEHKFSDKFSLGGTFLRMVEKPLTQKSTYGHESVNNTIYGLNTAFSTEVPFLTRMVNHLPNIDTDVPSNLSVKAEVAFLSPDTPETDKFNGESTIYVDDFEGSQSNIDMRAPQAWALSSTPIKDPAQVPAQDFQDFGGGSTTQSYGFKRARINWYTIDPSFYQGSFDVSSNDTRRVMMHELYPNINIATGQTTVVSTLDLSYYPTERGPYNNVLQFQNSIKKDNFGGLMRSLSTTNFEQANVEFIEFWVLDPTLDANGNPKPTNNGKLFFNLGEISEDILQDGKKQYENGLPAIGSSQVTIPTPAWGKVPASQSLIYAFDTDPANRAVQDLGFDGIDNNDEDNIYTNNTGDDPASDDYLYFGRATGTILDRYKYYNNPQGNSPVDITNDNRGSTTQPDVEDINRDNTMNTINAYYEYSIDIDPAKMHIGNKYVVDEKTTPGIALPDATTTVAHWVQYKIPIQVPENKIGGISDFRSIRFMRMFMTGFSNPITVRFGSLDLVRGEWRNYANQLDVNGTNPSLPANQPLTQLSVTSVSIIENNNRTPIPYVLPPGVVREQVYNGNSTLAQNEKSLSLKISGTEGLHPQDSRGVFKNVNIDMRQYKSLKMFMHAEELVGDSSPLQDNEMAGFIRFGNDFTDNFYQIEQPLKVSAQTARSEYEIWPPENDMDLAMSSLSQLKILSLNNAVTPDANGIKYMTVGNTKIGIKGNPNFGLVRNLMVGVKNTKALGSGRNIKGEVWFDELRLAGIDNKGGMAAIASMDSNVADFATVSASGKMSTIGFGALEQGTNERSREDLKLYNIVTNLTLGKLLPKKWGINLPFNYAVGEQFITPKYDPFNLDLELQQLINVTPNQSEKDRFLNRAIDYTKRTSINFIGVKKSKSGGTPHIYDPENVTLSYSFNQMEHHDFEVEKLIDQQAKTTVDYAFSFQPKAVEPFAKSKYFQKSSYWKLLQDFNFNYLPSSINFSTTILRNFNKQQFRQNEVTGLPLDPLFRRNYNFNYNYGFNYNLTKALKLTFTASTNNIVKSYLDEFKIANPENTIWTDYWNIGEPNQHNQQLIANYDLPINKIPFLSFIKRVGYTYTGNYAWQRASEAMSAFTTGTPAVTYNLGNTIQNSAVHKINGEIDMELFYKFIGLKDKKPKTPKPVNNASPKPGEKIAAANTPKPAVDENVFIKGLKGILMSVKNIKADYTENSGTVLPGYLPGLGFLGSSKPTLGFVFGLQDDVRFAAAQNGWLTNYPNFNQNYTHVNTKELKLTANVDLFPDFKIDLSADRKYAENQSEQFDAADGEYHARAPYTTGNFAISTVMLKTAFKESDENFSTAFNDFRYNRLIIANRLATERGIDITDPTNLELDGYPKHFGKNSQAVMLPAFLAAYTGFGITDNKVGEGAKNISFDAFKNIPLPNWNMKYTGLMRYQFFKNNFKRFSFQHAYKSSYTINAYRSNLDYDQNNLDKKDAGGNFLNKILISNVNLVEQFNPLISMDFELKNSLKILASIKKDRALSLSFDNSLLTEVVGKEFVVGFGYRIKEVRMNSKFADNVTGEIKSDINIKVDFSMRNTKTIIRYLDYDNNKLSGGQNMWSVKLTADYAFSRNLTAIFFYDHSFNKPYISTSFPMTNIRSGFTIRYAFGN